MYDDAPEYRPPSTFPRPWHLVLLLAFGWCLGQIPGARAWVDALFGLTPP